MDYLTGEQIIECEDLQFEDVEVPEWNGMVRMRGLTTGEQDAYEASIVLGEGESARIDRTNVRAKLVVRCTIAPDGKRLFADADVPKLAAKSAAAVNRLWEVARRLNGMAVGDDDELAKNSGGPEGNSSSSLPGTSK